MTAQYLEFVRQQLIIATADLSGATKGQLQAWLEDAQFSTGRFKRKKTKIEDEVTGQLITLDNPPIPGKQSRAKGSAIALVQPVEFTTSSWRRALLALDDPHKAWLLWIYSENTGFDYQVAITQWAWDAFRVQLEGRRIAAKTLTRLKALVWLAAQDLRSEIMGRETLEYKKLAQLMGITAMAWTKTFTEHWLVLKGIFRQMDSHALKAVSNVRSKQKAGNFQPLLVKVD
ncbi:bacteriophage antitermination protein Q [Candidatus Pantoea multigeneris]|uniref:Antiterminator n=1 Tax=Candidatus Pantoea multigeneris TaxID=2608357 RepID=A0ABX0R4F9_9GAMM|nr:bacteriophage antitermination protein Q [Pantoea multigeneris]NIF20281.1 hypothetical protein [Pantoea multigeneris]